MTSSATAAAPHRRDARRDELAESALRTLGELGYARTSLRDIASNGPFSHGVLHYYFRDRTDLIVYSIRLYKSRCVTRYDAVVEEATTAAGLASAFGDKLAETIVDEGPMHRLWYDLRTQSMFEPELRAAVLTIDEALEAMIWRVVDRYAHLADTRPTVGSAAAYAMLDGLFERALLGHLTEQPHALEHLRANAVAALRLFA